DENIDLRVIHGARRFDVAHRGDVMHGEESIAHATAHCLSIVGAEGKAMHLETLAIMRLESLDQQQHRRMIMKVVRKIADADFGVRGAIETKGETVPYRHALRAAIPCPKLGTVTQLAGAHVGHGQKLER